MENFVVVKTIESCRFSSTLLVTRHDDRTNTKLILKKIECLDENHANQTFREVLSTTHSFKFWKFRFNAFNRNIINLVLHQLELDGSPGTVANKEFFILVEKPNSSISICILRDFYDTNLSFIAERCHNTKAPIEEQTIIDYLCQLILCLDKYHQRNIPYRSIKLSNIFEEPHLKNLLLADFCISSLMADRKNFSFLKNNILMWQAPELISPSQKKLCELKADIWSLGAVIMSLLSASLVSPIQEFGPLLVQSKSDDTIFNDLGDKLSEIYSEDLVALTKRMLDSTPDKRPDIRELKKCPCLVNCLRMNHPRELAKTSHQAQVKELCPLQGDSNMEAVIHYLETFFEFSPHVSEALENLNKFIIKTPMQDFSKKIKELVLAAMGNHIDSEEVQISGFKLLQKLSLNCENEDYLFSSPAINIIIDIMKTPWKEASVKTLIYDHLSFLATSEAASHTFGSCGGMEVLTEMLREDINNASVLQSAALAMSNLNVNIANAKTVVKKGILTDLCYGLEHHLDSPDTVAELVAVLLSITAVGHILLLFSEHRVIHCLIETLKTNKDRPNIVRNCCITLSNIVDNLTIYDKGTEQFIDNRAVDVLTYILMCNTNRPTVIKVCCITLANLVALSEESAYMFLNVSTKESSPIFGLQLLFRISDMYKNDVDVATGVCKLMDDLSKHDEVCQDIISYDAIPVFQDIKRRFPRNKKITSYTKGILERLNKLKTLE